MTYVEALKRTNDSIDNIKNAPAELKYHNVNLREVLLDYYCTIKDALEFIIEANKE